MSSTSIILLAGLPGSGKTRLLDDFKFRGHDIIDDISDLSCLPPTIVGGRSLVISDVNFCRTAVRDEAYRILRARYPHVHIWKAGFRNDPVLCRANVRKRNDGRDVEADIRALAAGYDMDKEMYVLPVWEKVTEDHEPLPLHPSGKTVFEAKVKSLPVIWDIVTEFPTVAGPIRASTPVPLGMVSAVAETLAQCDLNWTIRRAEGFDRYEIMMTRENITIYNLMGGLDLVDDLY